MTILVILEVSMGFRALKVQSSFFLLILVILDSSVNRAVKIIAVLIDELFLP